MSERKRYFFAILSASLLCVGNLCQESKAGPQDSKIEVQQSDTVNRPIRDKWALVVGISEFADPSHNLQFPAKDARDFATYLVKEAGFAPDHVKLLINGEATEKRILSELGNKWLPRVANPDDLVVLFISTHGSGAELDVGGQNYLVAYDTDVNDLYTSGIPMNRLAQDIKDRIHCDRVVIFLDACHSGATAVGAKGLSRTGVDANELAVGSGQLVITSSTENQVSWESKSRQNSVFTASLLDALRSKGERTTLEDMFVVLKDKVQNTVLRERGVLQTPVMKSAWIGADIVLAAKPANPQAGFDSGTSTFDLNTPAPAIPKAAVEKPREPSSFVRGTTAAMVPQIQDPPIAKPVARSVEPANHPSAAATSAALASPTTTSSSDGTRPPAAASATKVSGSTAVKSSSLLTPGVSIGRTSLGATKEDVTKLLGTPGEIQGNNFSYRSRDKKFFLCIRFSPENVVESIAFNSPVFSTAEGINLGNYREHSGSFSESERSVNQCRVSTIKGGGFSILAPVENVGAIGVIHSRASVPREFEWLSCEVPALAGHSDVSSARSSTTVSGPKPITTPNSTYPSNSTTRPPTRPVPVAGPTNQILPGVLLGKTKIGSSRAEVYALLGKPGEENADVVTYWSRDRKLFVCIRLKQDRVTDIAFCSKSFATADGISVATYTQHFDAFRAPVSDSGWTLYTLNQGGFTIAVKEGRVTGWLHSAAKSPAGIFWP